MRTEVSRQPLKGTETEVCSQPLKVTKCEAGSRPTSIKGYQDDNVRLEVGRQLLKGTKIIM